MIINTIKEVPDELFRLVSDEIDQINWESVKDSSRTSAVFSTSTTIHIRGHAISNRPVPQTLREWCMICECEDNQQWQGQFIAVRKLADWAMNIVGGLEIGRLMIIDLAAGGIVGTHVDPYDYFKKYSRFHVPVKTNELVNFINGDGHTKEHMPYKYLSQLNNLSAHGIENLSEQNRIHVIIDIAVIGGNQKF